MHRSGSANGSIVEIGELCRRGRLPRIGVERLRGYVADLEAGPIAFLGVTRSVAVEAAMLPDTIRDPFDRLISATARVHGALS
jgi:PIN domain nuclease of toxin-antitoxin system